ncbi:hypothetical protein [Xanthobacter autotrophicus]|uniref:hypothetical protein n=1 Tax=Xanthobacter autotrophicus TaxID=280 RepID=UPI003728EAF1
MDLRHLTYRQRIWRRLCLPGGSYKHPDGHIELDFDAPAEIDYRRDSQELQEAKLDAYEQRRAASSALVAPFIWGLIVGASLMHYRPSLWPF